MDELLFIILAFVWGWSLGVWSMVPFLKSAHRRERALMNQVRALLTKRESE